MTDRELLELAAKAAGIDGPYISYCGISIGTERDGHICWNPLTDDGDALRLAVKLRIQVWKDDDILWVDHNQVKMGDDPYAATRRAIVRAAADIGKEMV